MNTNFKGTQNLLNIAKDNNSIFIQASTSEIYGDPLVHPQLKHTEVMLIQLVKDHVMMKEKELQKPYVMNLEKDIKFKLEY